MQELHRSKENGRDCESSKSIAMAPVLRHSLVSFVVVYCLMTALVLGSWFTGSSVTNALSFSSSLSTPDDSSIPGSMVITSTARRSISSLDTEEELDVGETEVVTPTPLDIPKADLQRLQRSLPQLYHSPHVFTLNYEEMTKKMKIFIYPSQNQTKYEHKLDAGNEVTEEESSTSDFFFRTLGDSKFVTENPERAQLFLLPVSIDALWVDLGAARVAEQLRRYVQKVRDNYPFWDRSLGADHFYLSCHAYPRVNHRNFLELSKNAIQVACSPLRFFQDFIPHKDIVLPHYRAFTAQETRAAVAEKEQRTLLAYYTGPLEVDPASASVLEEWTSDPDFVIDTDPAPDPSSTYKRLATSKFCVSISPHDTLNIVDSLRLGCVPVVISKSVFYDLPFQDILNWHEFAVVLDIKDIAKLKNLLTEIPPTNYLQMQYLGHQASKHMQWNTPPVAYDAFHMTLYELWLRRHSIRYARSNIT